MVCLHGRGPKAIQNCFVQEVVKLPTVNGELGYEVPG